MRRVIERNTILLNAADYSSGDLDIDEGTVTIAGTAISVRWDEIHNHKVTSYTAGNYASIAVDFTAMTAVDSQPHTLTFMNGNTEAVQREVSRTAWGDSNATMEEISDLLGEYFVGQNAGSSFQASFNDGANTLTVTLQDATYPAITYRTNIAGLAITNTAAVLPVGGAEAASLPGYDSTKDYDKYEIWEKGTFPEDGRDIPCLFHDVIYVDDTDADFPVDWAATIESGGASSVAEHVKYTEKPSA